MRRSILSAAIAAACLQASAHRSYGTYSGHYWNTGTDYPVAPTSNRERHCARCRVGILTGRLCVSCQHRGKR